MTKNPFQPFINQQGFVILDGGLATELEYRGADLNDPLWSAKTLLDDSDLIRNVHLDYLLAGADVIVTTTYQATFEGFAQKKIDKKRVEAIFQQSIQLALEAREQFWQLPKNREGRIFPLVAASIGPFGAYLADGSEYKGDYGLSVEELIIFHKKRLEILSPKVDLFAFETIPSFHEAKAIAHLLKDFQNIPAWVSFSCRDEKHISDGTPLQEAIALIDKSPNVVAIGVNCTPPEYVVSLLSLASTVTNKPLMAYPNSGEEWDAQKHCWLPGTSDADFGTMSLKWYAAGARLIGGCCRTRPSDIKNIRKALSKKSNLAS